MMRAFKLKSCKLLLWNAVTAAIFALFEVMSSFKDECSSDVSSSVHRSCTILNSESCSLSRLVLYLVIVTICYSPILHLGPLYNVGSNSIFYTSDTKTLTVRHLYQADYSLSYRKRDLNCCQFLSCHFPPSWHSWPLAHSASMKSGAKIPHMTLHDTVVVRQTCFRVFSLTWEQGWYLIFCGFPHRSETKWTIIKKNTPFTDADAQGAMPPDLSAVDLISIVLVMSVVVMLCPLWQAWDTGK